MKNKNPDSARHLSFLDGIRGLAALFVVIHHAYMEVRAVAVDSMSPLARSLTQWLLYGGAGVDVFIVLSGYCLMLPVIRDNGQLKGGIKGYFYRRARRIIPPYYAAIILISILVMLVPQMRQPTGVRWDLSLPLFEQGVILSHLFLVHNFNPLWIYKIEPTLWSIAVEWQIYFIFALLLLPIWRYAGSFMMLIVAVILGMIPTKAFGVGELSSPWLLSLFAFGSVAAVISNSAKGKTRIVAITSGVISIIVMIAFIRIAWTNEAFLWNVRYAQDWLVGISTASLLVFCAAQSDNSAFKTKSLTLRILESGIAVRLGRFSYSLYLIHFPVLSCWTVYLLSLQFKADTMLLIQFTAGVLSAVALSYLFFLVVERHFIKSSGGK